MPPKNYGSDVQFQMPPVHTAFLTAALERTPARADQPEMNRARGVLDQPGGPSHAPANPAISKFRYNVRVRIERNDLLFTLRGDYPGILSDLEPAMFAQMGRPKAVARQHHLPYASFIQHASAHSPAPPPPT